MFSRSRRHFEAANIQPAQHAVTNPGRGWYHIYTFRLGKPDFEQIRWQPYYEEETLALVRMDLSDFRETELCAEALHYADAILDAFGQHEKEVILRACYDTQGQGLLREPCSFSLVLLHLRQIGELALRHEQTIVTAQGLLVGSWGEMHTSRFLDPLQIRRMAEVWDLATGGRVPLAVRRPCQMRMLHGMPVGLYDDALCSDALHMGTFGQKQKKAAAPEEAWCPADELTFLKQQKGIFCGGEAVAGEPYSPQEILAQMQDMQVSYLNCVYDPVRLDAWRTQTLPNHVALYEEIGRRLGYCFVVRKAVWKKETLTLTIANEGFASACFATRLVVGCGTQEVDVPCSLHTLRPMEQTVVSTPVEGCGRLTVQLLRTADARPIRFCNAGAGHKLYLGELVQR